MKKISLALALLAITSMSQSALAQGKFSTGVGLYEFGGHTGVKYRYSIDDTHKLSASAGLIGYSLGYEYTLSEHITAGLALGQQVVVAEDGYLVAKFNYYFQGVDSASWVIGLSAGVKEDDGDCFVFCEKKDTDKIEGTMGIHLGYQF
ncbi:hypothetical protein AMS58_01105 [Pseudoalteromonas porphyrae]|uniref:hypothetical protein n=1 Tax=Pseudoalteromonas TaxID=53246 RepID=UPI0006BB186D|nr:MULTISPECIES: hypothetical protein [Pseudoalteromonas]KPH96691.1 hypothetical protein AMS58_01105 [Pseudoalteromonas porphyrae]